MDVKSFVELSISCRQFTRFDCFGAVISTYAYLVDKNGLAMSYIGGGSKDGRG